jgi:hypothetical protein
MTEQWQPHPGSRLDASAIAAAAEESPPGAPQPEDAPALPFTVPVRVENPEECIPRTIILSAANPVLPIMPRDMRRLRAIIIPVANAVYLTESQELAAQIAAYIAGGGTAVVGMGSYLPVGQPVPLDHRDTMWAAVTTTASVSPVTVIVQRYAT